MTVASASGREPLRILDPDNYKARVLAMFDKRSASYDSNETGFHPRLARCAHNSLSAAALVERAGLQPGERVLDLAAGTGWVMLPAARRVGPAGSVLGVDLTDAMLAVARQKARAQGLTNVTFEAGDADTLPLPPGGFDAALCSNGMLYFADVGAALRRIAGWLRPGGRLAFNTPVAPLLATSELLYELLRERHDLPLVDAGTPLADPPTTRALLLASGFAEVEVAVTSEKPAFEVATPAAHAERMWELHTAHPIAPLRCVLSEEQVEALRQPFLARATELADRTGINSPQAFQWVVARTPG